MEYAFIGGGNMGRALAAALVGRGVCRGEEILVIDPDENARERIAALGCEVREAAGAELSGAPVVVLAVKPQSAPEMFAAVRGHLGDAQTVVSIMAGITVGAIQSGLSHDAVVRVMPNTPAQVGLGMNVYYASPTVNEARLEPVEALFQASGETLQVESEDAIDGATAVSGSGPAYVFYMAEHWMNAAMKLGFGTEAAAQLVQQTLIGATALWKDQGVAVSTLREQVTSKGGTTAAALEHFGKHDLGEHFAEGVQKAYARAKELGS